MVRGDPDASVSGYSIDSRRIAAGDLFVAIRGSRFDGHAFAGAALESGAAGALLSEPPAAGPGFVVLVDDTVQALQAMARAVRRRSGAAVVAVTGSAGKTTTKEAAATMLEARYSVLRTQGNLNNHIGLPLSLLGLCRRAEVAVVEMGMSHAGEIRTLVGIADPDVRVWTNVAEVHTEFFASLDAVADAKAEIMEGASERTVLVANADDPLVMARVGRFPGRLLTFGLRQRADVTAADLEERALDGFEALLRTPAGEARLTVSLLGRANAMNVLAAAAVATHFEVPLEAIVERAAGLTPSAHRGEVIRLISGITVLDDSYNSNPRALESVLEVVGRERRVGRRMAVLGEMLELGPRSKEMHETCGRAAAAAGLAYLVTVGGEPARALGDSAVASGIARQDVVHVATSEEAAELVGERVRAGDLVLVKGSRGVGTDTVVERLKAGFA
jgi:UDP-N-acetylmuramoyl-tripeptide--D-alanyl-D-alanine ligase